MKNGNNQETRGFNLTSKYTTTANNYNYDPYNDYNQYGDINTANQKRLSFDGIILTTLFGLGIIIAVGAFASILVRNNPNIAFMLSLGSIIALIAMWAVIFFKREIKYPKPVFLVFSVLEGFVLGAASGTIAMTQFGDVSGASIVGQAVMGTVIIFLLCLFLYAQNIVRFAEHSKARKVLFMAIGGFGILYLVNFVISLVFGVNLLWGNGPIPIIVALIALVVASLSIIDDFGEIDRHVSRGAEDKEKWLLSLSLLSGIIWVYIELLRLLTSIARMNSS